jgi:NAD(P)H-dependent FMN reductase
MDIVGIAGSLRSGSFNSALLCAAVEVCPPYVGGASRIFDPAGSLADEAIAKRLRSYMEGFVAYVGVTRRAR